MRQLGSIILLIGAGAFLGWNVAHERWLLLVALAAVPLLGFWPVQLAVGAYVFLVPFDTVGVIGQGDGGAAITFLAGALAGAVLLVTGYLRRSFECPPGAALWWFLFVVWGGVSSLWAIDENRIILFFPTALGLLALYLVAASVRITREEYSWIVLATIMGGCAAAIYSSSQFYGGVFFHGGAGRSSLIVGEAETDPNVFATTLFLPLSLVVGRFLESRGWYRIFYSAMGALISLALVLTMSRGAMLGLAVMVFVYFRRLGLDRRVFVPISIVLLSLLALPDSFLGRVQNAESSGGAGRLYIWEVGLASLKKYGLIGAGLRNFDKAYAEFIGEGSRVFTYHSIDAHNIYLLVAVELGVVGLGLMGMAIFSTIRAGRRIQDRLNQRLMNSTVPYEAAAWAVLTSSFFVGTLWRKSFWLVWIMYAMVVRLAKEKTVQPATNRPKAVREMLPSAFSWSR